MKIFFVLGLFFLASCATHGEKKFSRTPSSTSAMGTLNELADLLYKTKQTDKHIQIYGDIVYFANSDGKSMKFEIKIDKDIPFSFTVETLCRPETVSYFKTIDGTVACYLKREQ